MEMTAPTTTSARTATAAVAGRGLAAAVAGRGLAAATAVLVAGASAAGLWVSGLYADGAAVEAMFRGYDLVSLVLIAPLLALTLPPAWRDHPSALLLRVSLLAFCVYNYAYYLFGGRLNAVLLAHIAIFTVSLYGLILSLASLDVDELAAQFRPRTPVRVVAGILLVMGGGLAALQLSGLAAFALTHAELAEPSQLVVTPTFTRLGAVLDLALLVPVYMLAAGWLWRRRAWGYVLAAITLLAGALHQVSYVAGMAFQLAADIPGAAFDPLEPFIIALYLVGGVLLLAGLRPDKRAVTPPAHPQRPASSIR
jgi:hypothetical protein